jgi:hypothetical protein
VVEPGGRYEYSNAGFALAGHLLETVMDWKVLERSWARGKALHHAGSNTQWYSVLWLAPNLEFGVVAVCNAASRSSPDPGAEVTDEIVSRMIGEFLR